MTGQKKICNFREIWYSPPLGLATRDSVPIAVNLLQPGFNLVWCWSSVCSHTSTCPQPSVMLIQCVFPYFNLPSTQCDVDPVCVLKLQPGFNLVLCWSCVCSHTSTCPQPSVMLILCVFPYFNLASTQCNVDPVCVPILQPGFNTVWCWSSVCSHISTWLQPSVMLIQCVFPYFNLASTQCDVDPVCVPILQPALNPVWCWSSVCSHTSTWLQPNVMLIQCVFPYFNLASTQCDVDPVCVPILQPGFNPVWCWSSVCSHIQPGFNPVWCWSSVCSHTSTCPQPSVMLILCVFPYFNLASTQCDVDPVCVPIFQPGFNPVWCWSSVCSHTSTWLQPNVMLIQCVFPYFNLPSTQCDVDPVCVPILQPGFNPMWCWSSVCSHTSTWLQPSVMLIQCVFPYFNLPSTQCDVDPVCVPILQPGFNPVWCWSSVCSHTSSYPQPSVMLIQCVFPYFKLPSTQCDVDPVCVPILQATLNPVWCWSSVCSHRAIINLLQFTMPFVVWSNVFIIHPWRYCVFQISL